ncbi:MAG: outer membrane protein [Campylobacterota bacterium]|nr:outer membrane protein [Campylobacterota bacterium]
MADTQTITIDECIEKSLSNHPDLKRLSLTLQKSKSASDIAKADYLPQVTLGAQYNPTNTFVMPQNGQFNTIHDDNWLLDAVLNQKIYDFSKTTSLIDASKQDEKIASLSLEQAKALLVYNVKNLYDIALFQISSIDVRKKDLQAKEELYAQAKALVIEGIKTKADEASILSALYAAIESLAVAEAEHERALAILSLYTGEKIQDNTKLEQRKVSYDMQEQESLRQSVASNNFELKAISEEIGKNALLYSAAKASNYGSIDAVASLSHQNSLNEYDTSMVGIIAKFPLYSGGRLSAQSQQAHIATEAAKESYNAKRLALNEEIETLLIDIKRYEYTIKTKEAIIESSKAAKEITHARYKEGLSTYIEVLDATTTHLYAELGLLEAKFNINKIQNRLAYLKGENR